jgi:signal transduction histidine kinase
MERVTPVTFRGAPEHMADQSPQDPDAALLDAGGPAAAVIRNKDAIIRLFREREGSSMISHTLPAFLTRVGLALAPQTHLALADVLREYQILREVLVDTLRADDDLAWRDWDSIHRSIDEAMAEAVGSFVQVQQHFRAQFTATWSHEFRDPLSNASNYVELLRRDADPTRRTHFATRALVNLHQLQRLLGELLQV